MKFIITTIFVLMSINVFAVNEKTFQEHFDSERSIAQKKKIPMPNDNHGYLVRIEAAELVKKLNTHIVYKSDIAISSGRIPIAIIKTKELEEALNLYFGKQNKINSNLKKLSREGGGLGTVGNTGNIEVYIKAIPADWNKLKTDDGAPYDIMTFRAVELCTTRTFKQCSKIQEPGILQKMSGFFD